MAAKSLKTTVNTDRGEAYTPKSHANDRVPEQIMATAREYGQKVVPEGVRFLVASVDVKRTDSLFRCMAFAQTASL